MSYEISHGTPIIWGVSGASGATHLLEIDGLSNGVARQGTYADLGASHAEEYDVYLRVETGTGLSAGTTVDLYLVCTNDTSNWPAKVTGVDGNYTLGAEDANLQQAGSPVISLISLAEWPAILRQASVIWRPQGRYVAPIFDNNLGTFIRNEVTNAHNDTGVILIPRNIA